MKIELLPGDYFREGKYFSKRFERELEVSVALDDNVSDEYVERCVDTVESFSDEMMDTICEAAKRYCLAFIALCKEDVSDEEFDYDEFELPHVTENTSAREMLQYFGISTLSCDEPENENDLYFRLSGGCDWEIEHGFEAAFCNGRLVYLGSFEDVSPSRLDYYVTNKGREWNYAL